MWKRKRFTEIERIMKGVANHRRVQILDLLSDKPELSVGDIAQEIKVDFRTTSEHTRKLVLAGLVMKRYEGNVVRHALTDRGKSILKFCRILE
jgi:DNA-binding transcriptional ArsR family regulator